MKSFDKHAKDSNSDPISRMKAPMIIGFICLSLIYKIASLLVENTVGWNVVDKFHILSHCSLSLSFFLVGILTINTTTKNLYHKAHVNPS
jgi:hypothetical protein